MQDVEARTIEAVKRLGIARPRDLKALGIPVEYAHRLAARGALQRVSRGLYSVPGADISAQRSLAEVAKAVPRATICLLSALRFHGLTTESPSEVWMALDDHAWHPRNPPFPVRVVYLSGEALADGVETHVLDGVPVRIYSAAKTVADCFKYRNKIGPEVAVEALKDYVQHHPQGVDALWRYAKLDRVATVMRPYLDIVG